MRRWSRWLQASGLAAAGMLAYLPATRAGFVFDDDQVLAANPLIQAPDGLFQYWFTARADDYWPVSSTDFWLEWRLWGANAGGYHWTNLALHLGSALLLWAILRRLAIPGSYLAALLFLVHPLNVESVAWIAQRKSLLALIFAELSVLCCLRSEGRPAAEEGPAVRAGGIQPGWYWLSVGAFTLAMLSKSSVALLPAVLGFLFWRSGRSLRTAGLRLAPFFLVATALVGVEAWFQRTGVSAVVRTAGWMERMLGAGAAIWFYLYHAFWPTRLAFFYPAWRIQPDTLRWWVPLVAAVGLTVWLFRLPSRWGRPLLLGWCYFVAMLIPVLGLTDASFMKYSLVADHYEQLALIGVVALAAAGWEFWRRSRPGILPFAAAAGVVSLFTAQTFALCGNYRDASTFYRAALERNPAARVAHNNLGLVLLGQGRTDEAIAHFHAALGGDSHYADARLNLGNAYFKLGRLTEAAAQYEAASAAGPGVAREAHLNLGHVRLASKRLAEAVSEYRAALKIDPGYPEAHYSLGNILFAEGHYAQAVDEYRAALRRSPADADIRNNLGSALVCLGLAREAVAEYRRALEIRPGDAAMQANLRKAEQAEGPAR